MNEPRVQLVAEGYDALAEQYLEWTTRIAGDPKVGYLALLAERLPRGPHVLELGCGPGEPCTGLLADRFRVTGVDVSERQLALARSRVPDAELIRGDLTQLRLEPSSFDAVAAFYSLNHVPRERLGHLFTSIHDWLADDGLFLASLDMSDTEAWTGEWLGTTMFFSGWSAPANRELLRSAGFELLVDDLVTMHEPDPDREVCFQWVLARR